MSEEGFVARIDISGIGIEYELIGEPGAHAVSLTPGGRFGLDIPGLREMGEALAKQGKRALLWDRPNCGSSDVCFEGPNESELHARTLTQLIRALDLGPTAVAGGSAGSRTSFIAAAVDPGAVSHVIPWWISGGTIGLMALGTGYCADSANRAMMQGMEAVTKAPAWVESIKRNPANRDRILAQDPDRFVETMERWAACFIPSDTTPVPGMSAEDFAALKMPVLIFRNSPRDLYHNARTSDWVHKLIPHSELVDAPWSDEELIGALIGMFEKGVMPFTLWPQLVPQIVEFTNR